MSEGRHDTERGAADAKYTAWDDLDALREVANIAAAHAATALSILTDRSIGITVPELHLVPLTRVPDGLARYAAGAVSVEMRMLGAVRGRIMLLMTREDADRFAMLLLGRAAVDGADAGMAESCLQETANVLGGAYAGALSKLTGHEVMLSVPKLSNGELETLLTCASGVTRLRADFALCVTTTFELGDVHAGLEGHLLLVSDPESLLTLVGAARRTAARA